MPSAGPTEKHDHLISFKSSNISSQHKLNAAVNAGP